MSAGATSRFEKRDLVSPLHQLIATTQTAEPGPSDDDLLGTSGLGKQRESLADYRQTCKFKNLTTSHHRH
jgi:hypothetical protein